MCGANVKKNGLTYFGGFWTSQELCDGGLVTRVSSSPTDFHLHQAILPYKDVAPRATGENLKHIQY